MKIINKIILVTMSLMLIFSLTGTVPATAREENIHGIPIEEFYKVSNAGQKLSTTLEQYGNLSNSPGYQLKMKQEAYSYMYNILLIAQQLGDNELDELQEHIINYNKNLKAPLTEYDQINAEVFEGVFMVQSVPSEAETKLIALIGDTAESEEITYLNLLADLRRELGYTVAIVEGSTHEDTEMSDRKINSYLRENITDIRMLMTSAKEYLIDYVDLVPKEQHERLSAYFVDTYNKVIQKAVENDVEGIKDMDLLGERNVIQFDPTDPNAHDWIGTWNLIEDEEGETTANLATFSEYMLKNIAASSTFEPFQTSMNDNGAFSFLGEENKIFHTAFGTKRKLLLTPTSGYNNITNGANVDMVKDLKFMTLREFIDNRSKPKILYLDNMSYSLEELDDTQKVAQGEKSIAEGETTELGKTTNKDNEGFWYGVGQNAYKATEWMQNLNPWVRDGLQGMSKSRQEDKIKTLVFISGDMSKESKLIGDVEKRQNDISETFLLYNNILEEYLSPTVTLKMSKDMDKPLYIDIYGNILSASGIVIIPAMANPTLFNDDKPSYHFNRAFIESYPQYTIKGGVLTPGRKDKEKYAFGLSVMSEDEIAEQEDILGISFEFADYGGESAEDDEEDEEDLIKELDGDSSGNLGEDRYGVIPGVKYHITKSDGIFKPSKLTSVNYIKPVANKFDEGYNPTKALDIWSFAKVKGSGLNSYSEVKDTVERLESGNRKALIEEYTAKLSYAESEGGEMVSFLNIPDSNEIKRFMYITSLEHIAKIEDLEIHDNGVLDREIALAIGEEIYFNGVYDINQLNSLVPDFVMNIYDNYISFLLGMANNRYDSVLSQDRDNNILYARSMEEVEALKDVLPLIYKLILLLSLVAIIIYTVLTVIVHENKGKQILKIVTILYLVTFLINTSGWMIDVLVNKPIGKMFANETAFWTLLEQENDMNLKKLSENEEVKETTEEPGTKIKLYKVPYNYPYRLLGSSEANGNISIDEFYEHYMKNDNRFKVQNNEMYVEGNYLVTDTKTLFESSSIVVEDLEDIRKKLTQEIYYEPELAYYMPYYMFVDNIIYNLNALTEINFKVPYDVRYASGTSKTTGRMHDYLNSAFFIDFDAFMENVNRYESSDKVSTELTVAQIKDVVEKYGNPDDFLGIRKILGQVENEEDIAPFTEEGLVNIQTAGWYPMIDSKISESELLELDRKALKVNDKVRRFMIDIAEVSSGVADEHIIKTIALYASFEFNKEFGAWSANKHPQNIELGSVPTERLLMALSVPRQDLVTNSVVTYPNYIVENVGYWGILLSSVNDLMLIFINYVKPFLFVIIWGMACLTIFLKKVILPDPNNRSILGSMKIAAFYILSSLLYGGILIATIAIVNSNGNILMGQFFLLIANLTYIAALLFMVYALLADGFNMGSSIMFKGLEGAVKGFAETVKGTASGLPIFEKFFGKPISNLAESTAHLSGYFEQKSIKHADAINDVGIKTPINLGLEGFKSVSRKVTGRGKRDDQYVDLPNRRGNRQPVNDFYVDGEAVNQRRSKRSGQGTGTTRNMYNEQLLRKQRQEELREQKLKESYGPTGSNQD